MWKINALRPRQNVHYFAEDTFKCIFLNENVGILIKISLKFVPMGPTNDIPALVQMMAWHPSGNKPLSEPMMVSLMTLICVTMPQLVKRIKQFLHQLSTLKLFHENKIICSIDYCLVCIFVFEAYARAYSEVLVWSLEVSTLEFS